MIKVLALLLGCFALAFSTKHPRMLYGRPVTQREMEINYQFVVLVAFYIDTTKRWSLCTGTLIKPDEVLLTAHCFCRDGVLIDFNYDIRVYFNSTQVGKGELVQGYIGKLLPDFDCEKSKSTAMTDFQANFDLATVRLEENVTHILPVTVQEEKVDESGQEVVMVSFGREGPGAAVRMNIGVGTTRVCDPTGSHPIVQGVYCVDANERGFLQPHSGDSGSPLLVRRPSNEPEGYNLIGVTKGGLNLVTYRCNDDGERVAINDKMGTWVMVTPYYNWILFNTTYYADIDVEKRKENRRNREGCCSRQ